MADSGATSGARPQEVTYAGYLLLLASLTGLIVGGATYWFFEDELSLLGIVLAVFGFILYTLVMKQDYTGWLLAVLFNIIAVFLYATGSNWPGVFLSILCVVYFMAPNTRVHFENR